MGDFDAYLAVSIESIFHMRPAYMVAPKPISASKSQFVFCSADARFVLAHARTFKSISLSLIDPSRIIARTYNGD